MKLTLILPCLNEIDSLPSVISSIKAYTQISKHSIDIIGIDDNSVDGSKEIIQRHTTYPILLDSRISLAQMFNLGLKKAIKLKNEIIIHMDSDGQYDAMEIERLIEPILNKRADIVIGDRNIWNLSHMPLHKKIGNHVLTNVVSHISKTNSKDSQSGFRAMTLKAAKQTKINASYTYTQNHIIQSAKNKLKIEYIPITFKKRENGSSRLISNSLQYGINVFRDLYYMKK